MSHLSQSHIFYANLETAFELGTLANVALMSGNIEAASNALLGGLTFQEIVNSGNVEAMKTL